MKRFCLIPAAALAALLLAGAAFAEEGADFKKSIYQIPQLKPVDSVLAVEVGDPMPDFDLPDIHGGRVKLSDYKGKKSLVLSFIPSAWTPVCSGQWPGYNIVRNIFDENNAALLGISVDNTPSQFAWVTQMGGVWFPVASDFWPHGKLAEALGILRSDGVAERALFLVDKEGIIRYIDVHDINSRPDLGKLVESMRRYK
jgi:peroxiredoxin